MKRGGVRWSFARQIPEVGQCVVAVAGDELHFAAIFIEDGAPHSADIGSIHMDADGGLIRQRIADLVHIPNSG